MARNAEYTTVDRILAQLSRIPNHTLREDEVIEDIGIALGFMVKQATHEEAVMFLQVKNNVAQIPVGVSSILRVSKFTGQQDAFHCREFQGFIYNLWNEDSKSCDLDSCEECEEDIDLPEPGQTSDPEQLSTKDYIAYKFPYAHILGNSYFRSNFMPVALTDNSWFSSLVCREEGYGEIYRGCSLEYNIRNGLNKSLVLSFCEGTIAVLYKRPLTDDETGYPLIPDNSNANEAILAFTKSKIFENLAYAGRSGYGQLAAIERERWGKYLKQYNNAQKMPQTEDEFENLLNVSLDSKMSRRQHRSAFAGLNKRKRL